MAAVAETAASYQRLRERAEQISVTEVSRDGTVRLTVSATGVLTDLRLVDRKQPFDELSAQIMSTLRRAQARIPDLVRDAAAANLGETDANTHLLVAAARERFPEPPLDHRPASRQLPPPDQRQGPPADDDWDESPAVFDVGR
ncbi:YbaB/EbfC family nucleoid-associated protein [Lentzea sp. E54]|uniref:YbaB/EbfC family nucleoid-associated protein n=1 Tax=Lentzea xerophila TaxID=3435883 RepID=UPI003DA563BB